VAPEYELVEMRLGSMLMREFALINPRLMLRLKPFSSIEVVEFNVAGTSAQEKA